MECTVTNTSSTRKTLALSFSAEEVNAAIDAAVAERRKTFAMNGFRKGKVPAATIEKLLGAEIISSATQDALDKAFKDTMEKEGIHPLSAAEMEDTPSVFERGAAYSCKLSFDVLPDIAFPAYEGLEVKQTKAAVKESEIEEVLTRIRSDLAEIASQSSNRLAEEGDQVELHYKGFDENNAPIDQVEGDITIIIGKKQVIDDFEKLVKTIMPGEEKEGPVAFPEGYGHKDLAGKTITMRVNVKSVKARVLPEVDDELAKKAGLESLEKLRGEIESHLASQKKQAARAEAMKKLLDQLLEQVTFDLPAVLVNSRVRRAVNQHDAVIRHEGKEPDGKYEEVVRPEVEKELRPQVFLMALARKENLEVKPQEIELQIYQMAMRAGQDYKKMSEIYHSAGLTNDIHDRLLADKAMDFIYKKANVVEVDEEPAA